MTIFGEAHTEDVVLNIWTNKSVQLLLPCDPIQEITQRARALVFEAIEHGWSGPPYDPFALARIKHIELRAASDVQDARTVGVGRNRFAIEYNPSAPQARIRYSICHEIAHTFFPDCLERVRNRELREHRSGDSWQLEMLCNIAAAEPVMPIGTFEKVLSINPSMTELLAARDQFGESTEAILLRFVKLTSIPYLVFATHRDVEGVRIEYSVPSRTCQRSLRSGSRLGKGTVLSHCVSGGGLLKNNEIWPRLGHVRVECLGLPPHHNDHKPRIVGLALLSKATNTSEGILNFAVGDATQPYGAGKRLIAHIVNDRSFIWGAGFGRAVRKRWPQVQADFRRWALSHQKEFRLGKVHSFDIDDELAVVHMIAQHGFGPSKTPRIRYEALRCCLDNVAEMAIRTKASIHMPRIGCGEAGGTWSIVRELINETILYKGISVSIYDLAGRPFQGSVQTTLFGG